MKHTEFGHSITFIAQDWDEHPNFTHTDLSTVGDFDSDSTTVGRTDQSARLHLDRNTWENWHLIPASRPTMTYPKQKTLIASDIPNVNGDVDLSLSQNKYPVFNNREGNFSFIYNPLFSSMYEDYKPWNVLYSEISEFIHGRKLRMVLEDDPGYYYEGRFEVESWVSNTDGSGSVINIKYSVAPYKVSIFSSLNEWLWDPFNFYNGVITNDIFNNIQILFPRDSNDNIIIQDKRNYKNIITNPNLSAADNHWYGKSSEKGTYLNLFGLVGSRPQIPIIYWKPTRTVNGGSNSDRRETALIVNYVNYAYGINYTKSGIKYKYFDPIGGYGEGNSISSNGVSLLSSSVTSDGFYKFKDQDMVFCDSYMGEYQFIQFIGEGTVKIEFYRGTL